MRIKCVHFFYFSADPPTPKQETNPHKQVTEVKPMELPNPPEVPWRPIQFGGNGEDVPFPLISYQAAPANGDQQYFIH